MRCSLSLSFSLSPKMASLPVRRGCLLKLLRSFCSNPSPPAPKTAVLTSSVRDKIKREGDPDAILGLVAPLVESPSATFSMVGRHARDIAVRRLAKFHRSSYVESLLEGLKKHRQQAQKPEFFLSSIIISYGKAGMIDHAIRTFDELESLGIRPSLVSFNSLLAACIQAQRFDKVPELFRDVPNRYPEILPDKVSYGTLAKALCETGSPDEAYSLLKEMEEKEIEVNTIAYTAILDGFYKNKIKKRGDEIWALMLEKGTVDSTAFNTKITNLALHGTPEDILQLLDEMTRRGLKPDIVSYNLFLTCYFKNGRYEEGKKVYEELKKKGCTPNAATYRVLLFHLSKGGDLDSAMKVCKESINRDKIPDFGTMKVFVQALMKGSKEDDAKWVIGKMKKRYHDSLLNGWRKLEASLGFLEEGKEGTQPGVAATQFPC